MSVVFPIATLLSCLVEFKSLTDNSLNFFLFSLVSQVIPNNSFLQKPLHFHTSLCFTVFHWVHCTNHHTMSMFDVSFRLLSQKESQWVISTFWATVFAHPAWEAKQPCLPTAIVCLAFIFKVWQCSTIAEALHRCYGSKTWLGLSCTVHGCMLWTRCKGMCWCTAYLLFPW